MNGALSQIRPRIPLSPKACRCREAAAATTGGFTNVGLRPQRSRRNAALRFLASPSPVRRRARSSVR
ncbi:hypothetical protein NDU88_002241 [Pleurodeles waltl]|uniref:Uncharacterized protein n=1 Tax=Pleurodeles waltl TaxID=8319 RepID=A0AAV7W2B1_PLEWA|nr:hypothetical protein NDU88_002241 [Pleurodeles waltl]